MRSKIAQQIIDQTPQKVKDEVKTYAKNIMMKRETSRHVATIKQEFRIGMLVWIYVVGDLYQFKIIGYDRPTDQWQVQWLTGPGSFYTSPQTMHKRKPKP